MLNKIGNLYYKLKDLEKATTCQVEALSIQRNQYDQHNISINMSATLSALANIFYKQSDFEKAMILYEEVLRIEKQVLPCDSSDLANIYNNLGKVYSKRGDLDKTVDAYENELDIERRLYACESPELLGKPKMCRNIQGSLFIGARHNLVRTFASFCVNYAILDHEKSYLVNFENFHFV